MADTLDYSDVYSLFRGCLNAGRLKLNKTGIVFKATKTGKIDSIPLAEIESTHWLRVARGFGIKIILHDGQHHKYDGFKEIDYEKLKEFYKKNYDMVLEEKELSVKGWNWGAAKFKGSLMSFEIDEKSAFEIPLKDVSQATIGKNEVTIEFHRNDDARVALMEMRFFVPANQDESAVDPVKQFHDQIMAKAEIIQATGDAIVTFEEVACLTPRGRYSIRVYPTFIQLHGKTYDYKIPHQTVLRLFLLPHQDNRFMFFVVSMDPPIRQGQTRYPFLILQFERDEEMTCKLNLTEEEIEKKYRNKLSQEMSGSVFEVISRVLKEVCGKKITVPGVYKSNTGTSAITCSYKASSGLLYPLERGFIFVHKPPVHIRFDEIASLNFARGSTTGRTFDFEMDLNNGTSVIFSNIVKEEYTPLFDFVNTKNLRIKNKGLSKAGGNLDQMIDSDDESHDAYLQKVKQEGRDRDDENDDSSDSDDDDFNPANEKADDVEEEYDSGHSAVSSSDEEEGGSGSEKKAKPKKRKSDSSSRESKPKKAKQDESGSSRKRGKKKDKNAPKRPMTAFMLFLNENREPIKRDNPGIAFTEIAKKGGEMWKEMTDKSKWDALALEAKAKYEIDIKEYKKLLAEKGETSPVSTPSSKSKPKSRSIKDMMKKNENKKDDDGKFKSKEYIDTSDDSSSDDEKKKSSSKKKAPSPTPSSPDTKSSPVKSSPDTKSSPAKSSPAKSSPIAAKPTRSKRGKGDEEELVALKEDSEHEEDEAEFSGEQSSSGGESDD